MANRSRDYYRKMRKRAIARKEHIIRGYRSDNTPHSYDRNVIDYGDEYLDSSYGYISTYWHVKNRGYLSKNKIHCSCPMCGFHGKTKQDKKSFSHLEDELIEYYTDNESFGDVLPNGVLTLISKIRKEKSGIWYPDKGYPGTKVGAKKGRKTFDYNEYLKINDTGKILESFCDLIYGDYVSYDDISRKYHVVELNNLLSDNNLEVHSINELVDILKKFSSNYSIYSMLRHYHEYLLKEA